ncbi:DUF6629 family protein [Flavitalea flava]
MCFSATASFISGGVLSAVGVLLIKKTEKKSGFPFASIPLLFGIQQIGEGIIWLTFHNNTPELKIVMTFIYSVFSHVLWPNQHIVYFSPHFYIYTVMGFYVAATCVKLSIIIYGYFKNKITEGSTQNNLNNAV